ncbi:MAG: FKBP-type peptidyl-prolyl cis-trans isomerase [Prevotellaceae bacterium]|nr:FKBP-type peptidyl-prolyl cis-trans isomerase [Prevotella sp.]MDD7257083.1 FKBP-type peptidyl-prolyl cis-trans isomerase [Prevotellaceae bacterium]MDY6130452.1 FKBP-type peptidyl-prolyl cis-trans isomerase [Prevotella sp.]
MEKNINKFIAVAYKLAAIENNESEFVEEATDEKPFLFISGFGITLEDFEKAVVDVEQGGEFDILLTKEQAYGDYDEEKVVDLDRAVFTINGHFDHENVFVDAVLPLQNEDGQRFYGRVLEITDGKVKIDLNHPLAGKSLSFKGHVVENREATNEEIQGMLNRLSGEGCGCGCGDCGGGCGHEEGGCGHEEGHDHDCGCGHCHH